MLSHRDWENLELSKLLKERLLLERNACPSLVSTMLLYRSRPAISFLLLSTV